MRGALHTGFALSLASCWAFSLAARLPGFWGASPWLQAAGFCLLAAVVFCVLRQLLPMTWDEMQPWGLRLWGWGLACLALGALLAYLRPIPLPALSDRLASLWRASFLLADSVLYGTAALGLALWMQQRVRASGQGEARRRVYWQAAVLLVVLAPLFAAGLVIARRPAEVLNLQAFWVTCLGIVLVTVGGQCLGSRYAKITAEKISRAGSGLRKFAIKGLLVIFPLLLFYGWLGYKLLPTDYHYLKQQNFESLAQKENIEVFYLGSSHASCFNPQDYQPVGFNFSMPMEPLYYDWKILERNLDKAPGLKLVIQTISIFTPVLDTTNAYGGTKSPYCWFFTGMGILPENDRWSMLLGNPYCSPVSLYGIEKSLRIGVDGWGADATYDNYGWEIPLPRNNVNFEEGGENRAKVFVDYWQNTQNLAKNARYLSYISGLTQKRGARLVLVTAPFDASIRRHIPDNIYSRFQQWVQALAIENAVPYINYYADPRFEREDFNDPHHLNTEGVRKMSQIAGQEVILKYLPEKR